MGLNFQGLTFIITLLYVQLMPDKFKKFLLKKMPQLVPFYFINQVSFAFILLIIMIYVFSKYILPRFVRLFISRVFISQL